MRILLTTFFALFVVQLAYTFWFDGIYRARVADKAAYQGQQFVPEIDYLIRKVIEP